MFQSWNAGDCPIGFVGQWFVQFSKEIVMSKKAAKQAAKKPESNESKIRKICKILGIERDTLKSVEIRRRWNGRSDEDSQDYGFSLSVETDF